MSSTLVSGRDKNAIYMEGRRQGGWLGNRALLRVPRCIWQKEVIMLVF